jgi:quinol monooxygenase YgiN
MSSNGVPSLSRLDALIASVGVPVRTETLEQAWAQALEVPASRRFHDRVRRVLEGGEPPPNEEVTILVTLRAKPGRREELEEAAREFVEASHQLEGILGSTLYRSTSDPLTLMLLERFVSQEAFSRHMTSDHFRRFQTVQEPLLARPVEAVFLEQARD